MKLERLRADGGVSANDLLLQIQADVLGLTVDRPAVRETTALDAALLAGMAVGFHADATAVADARRVARSFTPRMEAAAPGRLRALGRDAAERSRGWARAGR